MRSPETGDWQSAPFGSLCLRIVNGGTPETGIASYWDGDTPWITGADFTSKGIGEFRRFVTDTGIRASATSVVKQGNLLVVTRTGVGKLAVAQCDIAISQDITGIYIDPQKADTGFVYYLLSRELDELKKLNQGTSINGIVRADLENHQVLIPRSLKVQKRLVSIFRSIDTAIEKTDSLIAKHQQIKAGLMHDLFTRGVLPNGQLRPPRSEAPELYQETAAGWIPQDWALSKIGDAFEIQLGKMLNQAARGGRSSFPYVGNRSVQWNKVAVSALEEMNFSPAEREKFSLVSGDLLVCEGAMWVARRCGRASLRTATTKKPFTVCGRKAVSLTLATCFISCGVQKRRGCSRTSLRKQALRTLPRKSSLASLPRSPPQMSNVEFLKGWTPSTTSLSETAPSNWLCKNENSASCKTC